MTSTGRRLHFKTFVLITLMVVFGPLGDAVLRKGMSRVGAMASWAPADVARFFFRAFSSGMIWVGIGSLLAFFVAYMLVLSWADYSYVQPASSVALCMVALLGYFGLGEAISPLRWVGILVICAGVLVVGHTPPSTTAGG